MDLDLLDTKGSITTLVGLRSTYGLLHYIITATIQDQRYGSNENLFTGSLQRALYGRVKKIIIFLLPTS